VAGPGPWDNESLISGAFGVYCENRVYMKINCRIAKREVRVVPRALWKGKIIAESPDCHEMEGNVYFPPDAVNKEFLRDSDTHTVCPWKGTASYYDVVVDGEVNVDAAWFYPDPKEAAIHIKDYVAFWRGVTVES